MHVCLCAQACVPRIFFRGRFFWRMHVYACSHDMHILYECVHTRGTSMLHTIAPHTCTRWASFERQTYFSIFYLVFFFLLIFIWFRLLLDLFIHEVLLVYSLFQSCFFRFCSYTLKFERATTWWISWKRCSLFLPILRKLLSNVRACEVMLVAHSARQSIYWSLNVFIFWTVTWSALFGFFFSDKVWELFDARPAPFP